MADERQKTHHILLATGGKNITLELYDAALWPDRSSNDNEYRVRIDGKWYRPAGKYTFLSYQAVGELCAHILAGKTPFEEERAKRIKPRQCVRVHYGECFSCVPCSCERGTVVAPPFRGVDGRWRVFVSVFGGTKEFLLHDIDIV